MKGFEVLGIIASIIVLPMLGYLLDAYLLYKAWHWFAPKLYTGVPNLLMYQCLCIVLIKHAVLPSYTDFVKDEYKSHDLSGRTAIVILAKFLFLLLMWIVFLLIP